jgi:hypothetical protein
MKIALAMILTALTTVMILRMSASRESGHFAASQVAASATGPLAASPTGPLAASSTAPLAASSTAPLAPSRTSEVASPKGSQRLAAAGALPAPLEGSASSQAQAGTRSPRSEPVSYDTPDAGAAPAAMPSNDARATAAQIAALEQLVEQSRQASEQLQQINDQLQAQRQQAADKEAQRQADAEQEAEQHAATLEALGTLRRAQYRLAIGNSDGVDDALSRAEAALSGRTLLDVEAAREALAREDLYPARQFLAAALEERRPQY